ncbi:MAG: hypothetical protein PHQ19_00250 [Candidatus Krumholzibacteria bacterium]|nr:hypothetical protein [Candidatus Krumholzibacteria bacterium]
MFTPSIRPFPPRPFFPRAAAVVLALSLAVMGACSEDETAAPETQSEYLLVHHEGESTQVWLGDLPSIDVDGQTAVHLDELVDTSLVPMYEDKGGAFHDARVLYAYRIAGEDGFSASVKGYPDNTWDQMPLGYILAATRDVVFPDEAIDLPGAYNVKASRHVYVKRKFDVIAPDTTAFYELEQMPVVQVENFEAQLEDAVALSGFVSALIADPASRSYYITALDGYGTADPMTWTQLQTGYWLLETQKTIFTDPALTSGPYKLKMLERIEIE